MLDGTGGPSTGEVFSLLPWYSKLVVFGSVNSQKAGNIPPEDLIFRGKSVIGFYAPDYFAKSNKLSDLFLNN
jgi:hypothetical protein